jgi:hypothetical protein
VALAIHVITQIAINQGERLFPCGYKDPPITTTTTTTTGNKNSTDGGDDDDHDSDYSMLSI